MITSVDELADPGVADSGYRFDNREQVGYAVTFVFAVVTPVAVRGVYQQERTELADQLLVSLIRAELGPVLIVGALGFWGTQTTSVRRPKP